MAAEQIYNAIIENNLYEFNSRKPQSVVVSTIRSSCVDVDNKFTTQEKSLISLIEDAFTKIIVRRKWYDDSEVLSIGLTKF